MRRSLSNTIRLLFENCSHQHYGRFVHNPAEHTSSTKYMDIPIGNDVVEIPVFAFDAFIKAIKKNEDERPDTIVVCLNSVGFVPRYKTIDRFMQDVLLEGFERSRLVSLEVGQGDNTIQYYGCKGAVFDNTFFPVMMCSYQLMREKNNTAVINAGEQDRIVQKYKFIRGVVRVDPDVFLNKSDPMMRFLAGKMVNTCLEGTYYYHCDSNTRSFIGITSHDPIHIKAEIDTCPFAVHKADTPGISTSNQQLLQYAIDNIDELIQ